MLTQVNTTQKASIMAEGNKSFLGTLVNREVGEVPSRQPLKSSVVGGVLKSREDGLAEIAMGVRVENDKKLVDPAVCIMWERHNRDYAALTKERCSDLIESLKRHGKQEIPAIVRRVKGRDGILYEVICGARRHWAVSWLRSNGYPDLKYLIEIRHLSDEEAFAVSDLENRGREDISAFERAKDYAAAVDLYYGGVQIRMAERLGVDRSYVSRLIEFAKLPQVFHEAFGSPHLISEATGRKLAGLWKDETIRKPLLAEINSLREEQAALKAAGDGYLDAKLVLARLTAAGDVSNTPPPLSAPVEYPSKSGLPMIRIEQDKKGGFRLTALPKSGASRDELLAAFESYLETLSGDKPLG